MIETIKDCLVICNIDNTLQSITKGLPDVNRLTVDLFISKGGRFTVATSRTVESVQRQLEKFSINAPAITDSGSVIYDFQEKLYLQNEVLPQDMALNALCEIQSTFSNIGIELVTNSGRVYIIQNNEYLHHQIEYEHLLYTMAPIEEISKQWNKIVFAASPQVLEQLQHFIQDKAYDGLAFVSTSPVYLEMLPKGVSKGKALQNLCNHLQIPIENTVVIADYDTDIELMQTAGHAIAVENASANVKAAAHQRTGRCEDGGVAQVLYDLIRKYGASH